MSSRKNNALDNVRAGKQGKAVMPLVTTENKGCCIQTKNQAMMRPSGKGIGTHGKGQPQQPQGALGRSLGLGDLNLVLHGGEEGFQPHLCDPVS